MFTNILEILIVLIGIVVCDCLIYGHVICCWRGSLPRRHFERREDPGDEVELYMYWKERKR